MIGELVLGRSPVAIWADLVADGVERVCPETIYAAVFSGTLGLKGTACLRPGRPRRRSRQQRHANKRTVIATIANRPVEVNDRSEAGHWEADHIVGKANRSAMLHLCERVSRYSILITMPEAPAALIVDECSHGVGVFGINVRELGAAGEPPAPLSVLILDLPTLPRLSGQWRH